MWPFITGGPRDDFDRVTSEAMNLQVLAIWMVAQGRLRRGKTDQRWI